MSKLWLTSDLHLGHKNIHTYRTKFATAEEHHEFIYEQLAMSVNKRDTLYILGDAAFDKYWLEKIAAIKCRYKLLVCGNHDTERGITMRDLVNTYDRVEALYSKKNFWFSHAPLHPQELRGRKANIHGHLHGNMVWRDANPFENPDMCEVDKRYINVCLEHTDWKPVSFEEATLGY